MWGSVLGPCTGPLTHLLPSQECHDRVSPGVLSSLCTEEANSRPNTLVSPLVLNQLMTDSGQCALLLAVQRQQAPRSWASAD